MNRKQKIIVSITGIFIVLLILAGLTYAYFLTRINGNTNTKSISATTANLELVYGDGNANVITAQSIRPGTVIGTKDFTVTNNGDDTSYIVVIDDVNITNVTTGVETTFESNDFVYTITCTSSDNIECNGQSYESKLPLTNKTYLVANNIKANTVHTYNLTVTYKETGVDQSNDMNKKLEAKVDIMVPNENPYSSNKNSLAYHIINNSVTNKNGTPLLAVPFSTPAAQSTAGHEANGTTYQVGDEITEWTNTAMAGEYWLYYADGEGPTVYQAVQTYAGSGDISAVAPYLTNQCRDTIGKYIIIAESLESSETYYISGCNGNNPIVGKGESVLSITADDLGTSYYYRGAVEDNYVDFANMCWRIVRIEGDGSVKLILEDKNEVCSASMDGNWDINNAIVTPNEQLTVFKNFQKNQLSSYLSSMKPGNWCYDDLSYADINGTQPILDKNPYYTNGIDFYYDSYVRLTSNVAIYNSSLKCNGTVINSYPEDIISMYVGTITADEAVYAGVTMHTYNDNYYLINKWQNINTTNFWTLSPAMFNRYYSNNTVFNVRDEGDLDYEFATCDGSGCFARPAVSLMQNITISSGEGTQNNPYKIN